MIGFNEQTFGIEMDTVEYAYLAILRWASGLHLVSKLPEDVPTLVMSKYLGEPDVDHLTIIGGEHEYYYTRRKGWVFIAAQEQIGWNKMQEFVGGVPDETDNRDIELL